MASALAERGAFAFDVILLFLPVELDEDLIGGDAVAQIGEQAADPAVGFGRDRDFGFGGQGGDHFNCAADGLLAHGLNLHRPALVVAGAGLGGLLVRAGGRRRDTRRRSVPLYKMSSNEA